MGLLKIYFNFEDIQFNVKITRYTCRFYKFANDGYKKTRDVIKTPIRRHYNNIDTDMKKQNKQIKTIINALMVKLIKRFTQTAKVYLKFF